MARSQARIHCSVWRDADFTALSASAQGTYWMVLSQSDVTMAGVVAYLPTRWVQFRSDPEGLDRDLRELERGDFLVIDGDTHEVWVRSFAKNDGALKSPKTRNPMWSAWRAVLSGVIRRRFVEQLDREVVEEAIGAGWVSRDEVADALSHPLPDGVPDALSGGGADTPSDALSDTPPDTPPDTPSETGEPPAADTPSDGGFPRARAASASSTASPSTTSSRPTSGDVGPDAESQAATLGPDWPAKIAAYGEQVHALHDQFTAGLDDNGVTIPRRGTKQHHDWLQAFDRLLRKGPPGGEDRPADPDEVRQVIAYVVTDDFESANVHSAGKLRQRYDQLRMRALRSRGRPRGVHAPSAGDAAWTDGWAGDVAVGQ